MSMQKNKQQIEYVRLNAEYDFIKKRALTNFLINEKLNIDDQIKFYFWINVAGVTTISDPKSGQLSSVFQNYKYLEVNAKLVNGFKLMNDDKEMMKLILPTIKN